MTDKAKALIVFLADDYRVGDKFTGADPLIAAIECFKGVISVEPLLSQSADYMARQRVKFELRGQLFEVLE